jgi:hypothetical protein
MELLPTLEPDMLLFPPNQSRIVTIYFYLPRAVLQINDRLSPEPVVSYDLQAQTSPSEPLRFALAGELDAGWGIPFIVAALNVQVENWDRPDYVEPDSWYSPYWSVTGSLVLSPDARTMAYSPCNEYGGRGQWCSDAHVWFFDLQTGEARQADLGDYGIRYIYSVQFSEDSQVLSASGCLNYPNAYFGWCGDTIDMIWEVVTGRLRNAVVVTATPQF